MIYKSSDNCLEIPIDSYANQLAWYLQWYLNRIENDSILFSEKATEKAKIYLRWVIFKNNKEFEKDFDNVKYDIGNKTNMIIREYTKCIMQLLGQVAECVIVDRCASNPDINRICINIARFKPNIYEEYSDIQYEEYLAFSTSFKYIIYKDEKSGMYLQYNIPDYNPNHTSKDIAWCKKKNFLNQLKVDIPALDYLDNAKLQIKTTLNSSQLDLNNYYMTPVICFDLCNDIQNLKNKFPKHVLFSMREISPEVEIEVEKYFRILAAYATGLIDHINISDIDVQQDFRLAELFRTPIMNIVKERELDLAGVIDMAEDMNKSVVIGV
jgi:hypothetical protein